MQQHNEQERAGWVRLGVPLPPRLAEAVGYRGQARWVALHWEPCGDESFYDDGRTSGTGAPWPYLTFVRHPAVAPELAAFNLGSSDAGATECLLLDRGEQAIYVAPVLSARRFLAMQHPPPPPQRTAEQGRSVETSMADLLDLSTWRQVEVRRADVERAMREGQQAIEAMVSFLDRHVK
jgi:hypothetical protein